MLNILYYISGHGYGHAVRAIEVMRALARQNPGLFFHIRSDAAPWLFAMNLDRERYALHPVRLDIGAVQKTSFHIDKKRTCDALRALYDSRREQVEKEVVFARQVGARLVVSDIVPLAFDVAEAAGLPSLAVANFSWDWIYAHYVSEIPAFAEIVDAIRQSYRKATLLLRLPFHGDLSVFPRIKDIPLIARKARMAKEDVLRRLGMSAAPPERLALVAFRAADLAQVNLDRLASIPWVRFLTLGLGRTFRNSLDVAPDFLPTAELARACDVVVSKPGYGLVSEILANRTPLLYTSRDDFAEYEVLERGLRRFAHAAFLPRSAFLAGEWEEALRELLHAPPHWLPIAVDGAEKAAQEVLTQLESSGTECR